MFQVQTMAGHGYDITLGMGRGQQNASLSLGRGRSVMTGVLNDSTDHLLFTNHRLLRKVPGKLSNLTLNLHRSSLLKPSET